MASKKAVVAIKYSKAGTQPPIYIAGSFSVPEWQPEEMQYTTDGSKEHTFFTEIEVEEGKEYQYKFRVGPGDWWVLDEESAIVSDSEGNRNNSLKITQQENTQETKSAQEHLANQEATSHTTLPEQLQNEGDTDVSIENLGGDTISTDILPITPTHLQDTPQIIHPISNLEPTETAALESTNLSLENHHFQDPSTSQTASLTMDGTSSSSSKATSATMSSIDGSTASVAANVAAEVADSAAILDRDVPTPPISDEEAGKIGFRRMSNTPIPQVAETAAEVADAYYRSTIDMEFGYGTMHIDLSLPESCKNLSPDERYKLKKEQAELIQKENEEALQTPGAKLIAAREDYLSLLCRKDKATKKTKKTSNMWETIARARGEAVELAYKQGKDHTSLGKDERHLMKIAKRTAPSYWCKASEARRYPDGYEPQLESDIAEMEDKLEFLKYRAMFEAGEGDENVNTFATNNKLASSIAIVKALKLDEGNENQDIIMIGDRESYPPDIEFSNEVGEETTQEGIAAKSENDFVKSEGEIKTKFNVMRVFENTEKIGESLGPELEASSNNSIKRPHVAGPKVTPASSEDSSILISADTSHTLNLQSVEIEKDPVSSVTIQTLAAPDLKHRKKHSAPAIERPVTPNSMQHSNKDVKSRHFLQTFWRTVFVNWIGGIIMRLCGGNRKAALAVTTFITIAATSTLYLTFWSGGWPRGDA